MNLWSLVFMSFREIGANRARSILTTLGIIIGSGSVVALVTVTQGARSQIETLMQGSRGRLLMVRPGMSTASGVVKADSEKSITRSDAKVLMALDGVQYASPILKTTDAIMWRNKGWFTAIVGAGPEFVQVNEWPVRLGTFLSGIDVDRSSRVCVLGNTVAVTLFGQRNPVGEREISNITFTIVGVLAPMGVAAHDSGGRDYDDLVLVPFTTLQDRILGVDHVSQVLLLTEFPQELSLVENQARGLLRERHGLNSRDDDDFHFKNDMGGVKLMKEISNTMTILLACVASISLVVGGIGIMNVMLVSGRERTREIGVRMAIGARKRDILFQFLVESVTLSLLGGGIGVVIGLAISLGAGHFVGWDVNVSIAALFLAFGFSATTGLVFGMYPAKRASQLNPTEALRSE